jgi:hypothetical protein
MTKSNYWKVYYNNVKKHKSDLRPVKICQSCGLPIINPATYKSNVHMSSIKGVRSECQKKRDRVYKKSIPKSKRQKRTTEHKKPKGIFIKYNIKKERICLKCNKDFPSQSLHNRICERCKMLQEDIMNFNNTVLETSYIDELFDY